MLPRRAFMSASTALSLGLLAAPILAGCARPDVRPNASEAAWRDLAGRLRGRVLRPGDAGFAAASRTHNMRFDAIRPMGVALCACVDDVSHALRWCRDTGMMQVPRSGGHNYMGYSTTEGLLISVSPMNSVRYQEQSGRIIAAGGAQNRDMSDALRPHHVMTPGGLCPTVGVAGLTLGGGVGFSMRLLGLTCDNLVATQLVLADGNVVTASASENADVFWALRGGAGGNFGINTEFSFVAHPARDCTHFFAEFPMTRSADVLAAWFGVLASAPRELGFNWYALAPAPPGTSGRCGVWGQMYGPLDAVRDVLAPILRAGGEPVDSLFAHGTYWEATEYFAEAPKNVAFYDRSRFVDSGFDSAAIASLTARLDARPSGLGTTTLFGWGGAVGDRAPEATAFVHRRPVALLALSGVWQPGDRAAEAAERRWVDDTFAAMQPFCSRRSFQNFPDGALTDWARAYYGPNLDRLAAVKNMVDPDRVFDFPQAIPTG